MQRVIKFQLLNLETKEAFAYEFLNDQFSNGLIWNTEFIGGEIRSGIYEKDNVIRRQFTGIFDKNGKEIYEGDILSVGQNLTCEIIFIGNNSEDWGDEIHGAYHAKVLRYDKIIPIDSYFKSNCILIGNIYQNGDLLK